MTIQTKFQQLAADYNLTQKQIFYCVLIAAGTTPAEAYAAIFGRDNITNEQATTKANQLHKLTPSIPAAIEAIKTQSKQKYTETAQLDEATLFRRFKTKEGVIRELITAAAELSGKDAVSALQTVAKLQGFDRIEEKEEEERRRYFLPYVSTCRNCELMKIYRDANEERAKKGGFT